MPICVEAWGNYACFTRPEMKAERMSYSVMTPSAARGLLEAIFFHPGLVWRIDRIHVLNPISFTNIRRNEVRSKISAANVHTVMRGGQGQLFLATPNEIQQRAAMVLRDVRYVIEAHFELLPEKMSPSDSQGKFSDIMRRRLEKGQCFYQPGFGCREFTAHFRPWAGGKITTAYPQETRDLGWMLYDLDYSDPNNITPVFFPAKLINGVLELSGQEVEP